MKLFGKEPTSVSYEKKFQALFTNDRLLEVVTQTIAEILSSISYVDLIDDALYGSGFVLGAARDEVALHKSALSNLQRLRTSGVYQPIDRNIPSTIPDISQARTLITQSATRLDQQREALRATIQELETTITSLQAECSRYRDSVDEVKLTLAQLQTAIKEQDANLNEQLKPLENELTRLNQLIYERKINATTAQQTVDAKKAEIRKLKKAFATHQKTLAAQHQQSNVRLASLQLSDLSILKAVFSVGETTSNRDERGTRAHNAFRFFNLRPQPTSYLAPKGGNLPMTNTACDIFTAAQTALSTKQELTKAFETAGPGTDDFSGTHELLENYSIGINSIASQIEPLRRQINEKITDMRKKSADSEEIGSWESCRNNLAMCAESVQLHQKALNELNALGIQILGTMQSRCLDGTVTGPGSESPLSPTGSLKPQEQNTQESVQPH